MEKLNDKPGKNPFKVPDNYFEDVNRKIISEVSDFDREVKKVSLFVKYRKSLLIAASIAGFMMITYTGIKLFSRHERKYQVSEILREMSPDTYLNDIDISSLENDTSVLLPAVVSPEISKNDIIDYLLQENVELSDIYEHL